jgi:hypothetical protein
MSSIAVTEYQFILETFCDRIATLMVEKGKEKANQDEIDVLKVGIYNRLKNDFDIYIMDEGRRLALLKSFLDIVGTDDKFIKQYGEMKYKGIF